MLAAFAALVAILLATYGRRSADLRPADTPVTAAHTFVSSDNTAVGLLGGIRELRPTELQGAGPAERALAATVIGARDSARLFADLAFVDERWEVERALLVMPDGQRLPLAGGGRTRLGR